MVVDKFDIERDCGWCGERLHEGHRFSVYCEYDESMKDFHAKLIQAKDIPVEAGLGLPRETKLIVFNFHGRCANTMYGRQVAASEK